MGAYLSAPKTEKVSDDGESGNIRFGVSSMQGWRTGMEDAHLAQLDVENSTACFGVFDGHGGKEVALFVASKFIPTLQQNANFSSNKPQALIENFLQMDELLKTKEGRKEILRIQRDLPAGSTISDYEAEDMFSIAGCTAVCALVNENELIVANAGDSRCVLARGGRAHEMSIDHKPELPSENARIIAAGGCVEDGRVNGNLNLSRSIGDLEYKKNANLPPGEQLITALPEIRTESLGPDDKFVILACDGV